MATSSPSPSPLRQRSDTITRTPSLKRKRSEESPDKKRVKRVALPPQDDSPMKLVEEIWKLYKSNGSRDRIDELRSTLVKMVNELSGGDIFYGITERWFSTYHNSKFLIRERVQKKEREERDQQENHLLETTRLLLESLKDDSDSDSDSDYDY